MRNIAFVFLVIFFVGIHSPISAQVPMQYPKDWETVRLKGLNLKRLQVPGGWLVREGLGKFAGLAVDGHQRIMLFVPDAQFVWQPKKSDKWQKLRLSGLNLYRLKLPQGWLVREGYGKIGSEDQTQGILYLSDPEHTWQFE